MDLSTNDFNIRQFYEDALFYEYCPDSMQTVSLVERILKQLSYIHDVIHGSEFIVDSNLPVFYQACAYVEELLNIDIIFSLEGINYKWDYSNILNTLKENARSVAVKFYFGL